PPVLSSFVLCLHPVSTLCPYTTLFRSARAAGGVQGHPRPFRRTQGQRARRHRRQVPPGGAPRPHRAPGGGAGVPPAALPARGVRSEEHTSELQSRENLVCRLLLEKKQS